MVIKMTYGLAAALPLFLQPKNAAEAQKIRYNFHNEYAPLCISMADALAASWDGDAIRSAEIVLDKIIHTNEELIKTINTLKSIGFLKASDEIDISAYVPDDGNLAAYEHLDLARVRDESDHLKTCSTTYKLEGESDLVNILHSQKVIKSKNWTTAGEMYDNEGEIVALTPKKPVDFKELRNLIRKVCAHMTDEHYQYVMTYCVEVKNGSEYFEEDGGWRDFSWYQVRMKDFETVLEKLGYLKPFLRKIAVDNILADM